jgi:hypothetical protein
MSDYTADEIAEEIREADDRAADALSSRIEQPTCQCVNKYRAAYDPTWGHDDDCPLSREL